MKYSFLIALFIHSFLFGQDYKVSDISEALKKNANAVIRNDFSEYSINAIDDIVIKENSTITILNKAGDDFARIVIPYDKLSKVSDIKVNILDSSGKSVKSFSKKDFVDISNTPSFGLYVDDRVLLFKPIATNYPYTFQYSYSIHSKNTVFINNLSPIPYFNIAAEKVGRKIINNSGIQLRTKITDTEFGKVEKDERDNTFDYAYKNIAAIVEEPLSPSFVVMSPTVEFALNQFSLEGKNGVLNDWNSFGKWYYNNLLAPATEITPELNAEVVALKLSGSNEEKVRKIYQYMQEKTRYVFVSMGIGGWQPMNAEEVRKKGYGDCKALSNYMRALLKSAGITSYYAVINSDISAKKFDPNFPKMSGNHVILMVPNDKNTIWLENTSQKIAFNHLSYSTTNRNVLAVKDNGIEIVNTPIYTAEQSKELIKAKVKINTDNSISVNANFDFTGGQYDFNMPLVGLSSSELNEELMEEYNVLKIQNLLVNKFSNDKNLAVISYELTFNAKDFSKKLGNDLFFRAVPFLENNSYFSDGERKLPFETKFAYQDDYEIEFDLPTGYHTSEIPVDVNFSSEFGDYALSFKKADNKLIVKRKISINKGLYTKEQFSDYLAFRKKTASSDNTKILISAQ